MQRLLIVSNRLPVKINEDEQGNLTTKASEGGLATGMKSVYKNYESLWFGWSGMYSNEITKEKQNKVEELLKKERCVPISLSEDQINNYYYGFSNKTLWPLFHYFTQFAEYDETYWQTYKQVNQIFAEVLKPHLRQGDKIWIHDYHLFLLPQLIRDYMPQADIGFFLHIPFPSFEVFRQLPWREEILNGILGADLVGFHTFDYERHFMSSIRRQLGYENTYNRIRLKNRVMKVDAFPMGIDFDKFHSAATKVFEGKQQKSQIAENVHEFFTQKNGNKLILSMDRLDYSKGIYNRLLAFEKYLELHPEYHEKVSMFMLSVPSRTSVEHYQILKSEIDETVGRINSRFGSVSWMPIWYLFRSMPFEQLIELYSYADIALITPIRDGMNLIAKEYMACRINHKGVLILSEMAGAVKELGESIVVNPNDIPSIANAIDEAIHMPEDLQVKSNKIMMERLKRYNVEHWAQDFMDSWFEIKQLQEDQKTYKIHPLNIESINRQYIKSNKRLLILDYDGTLVPFKKEPQNAIITQETKKLLENINDQENTDVFIFSERDRGFLNEVFSDTNLGLIAEHGVCLRYPGGKWEQMFHFDDEWKPEIRDIFQLYTDRTPGSFIEEKSSSLAWHYRKADPDLGNKRAWELNDSLRDLLSNQNIEVNEGKKVLEVKQSVVNKGLTAEMLMQQKDYDFILAMGDDWSDENTFQTIEDHGISVKIGLEQTQAHYFIEASEKVVPFLNKATKI
ncbi:MAG: bifunctional alpha,alpha-trehalose-phosphate synthase (UDP-forming)/trehalose-phosphatase [Bacteroidales bacterium]|nr:bifunctional alpha,alpha-trehalose-phosphate synthase (UDP-forming)/trehalose-phosphatase [Bacteroidales bacterium]